MHSYNIAHLDIVYGDQQSIINYQLTAKLSTGRQNALHGVVGTYTYMAHKLRLDLDYGVPFVRIDGHRCHHLLCGDNSTSSRCLLFVAQHRLREKKSTDRLTRPVAQVPNGECE